jgi:uncharacterized protein YxeA
MVVVVVVVVVIQLIIYLHAILTTKKPITKRTRVTRKIKQKQNTEQGTLFSYTIRFFNFYVPSQQLQDQLQIQLSVDTGNYIKDNHNIKTRAT